MKYHVLDVETANPDYSSICQIGIATFIDNEIYEKYVELINPEDTFDPFNISIHGIDSSKVAKAKKFPEIFNTLVGKIGSDIVIHHMPFDKVAIAQASDKYHLKQAQLQWLDSAKIARKAWDEFKDKGYGLSNICEVLGIKFEHHNALEDAIAAGKMVGRAIKKTGIEINEWMKIINTPFSNIGQDGKAKIQLEGNPEGLLYGETIVFTGELSIPRKEATIIAANAGCNVVDNMNKKVTILVVGQQDLKRVGVTGKSTKQLKAEELKKDGIAIEIIGENDFLRIARAK